MSVQDGLLHLVLIKHPTILAAAELKSQMNAATGDDAFDRALETLEAAGLLRREGESVFPTLSSLTFERLS